MLNKEKIRNIILAILLLILMVINFGTGFLGYGKMDFKNFQNDSEFIVFTKLYKDKYNVCPSIYGLATITENNDSKKYIGKIENIKSAMSNYNVSNENIEIKEYKSQMGLQGHFFSFLYNKLHISITALKVITCTLLSIILLAICYFISKKYNKLLGVIFFITFLISPWVTAFARNLYWVEFTWFLPVLLGLILSINYSKKKIVIPVIFLAIFIKCLCGYEYITSIMMMTISFFVFDFFIANNKEQRKEILKTTIIVGLVCLLGFFGALFIHGFARGNGNLILGLKSIYKGDVLRRTIAGSSNSESFPEKYRDSIESSVSETIDKYFNWKTDIILGIQGEYFKLLFVAVVAILIYNLTKRRKNYKLDIIMFVYFLLTTLSWYVLAKSHSYIHTHINFVLWYFGFIQMCIYTIINFIYENGTGKKLV